MTFTHTQHRILTLTATSLLLTIGCGGGDEEQDDRNNSGVTILEDMPAGMTEDMDTSQPADMGEEPEQDMGEEPVDMIEEADIPGGGDDLGGGDEVDMEDDGCDEAQELIATWPLHDRVATTPVTSMMQGDGFTATVDASAGGFQGASANPFIYLDLDSGAKVDVTDYDAITTNTEWEIAMRRSRMFINGGEAGPGAVEIALLKQTSFDEVTSADIPADSAFITEDPVDDMCVAQSPPSGFGTVISVFEQIGASPTSGSWFEYQQGSVSPVDTHVYILRNTDMGATYKFGITGWNSGVYTIQWAPLP